MQVPKAATLGVLRKFRKIHRKLLCQRKTCEFCKIFKNTIFIKQLRTTTSKSGYWNNEARDIDCICCRELDAMLIALAKSPRGLGKNLTFQL